MAKQKETVSNGGRSVGRPVKASFEAKRGVVDAFLITECADNIEALKHHGLYVRLEKFAQGKGYPLYAHDFSKDKQIVQYITSLQGRMANAVDPSVLPAYTPLDIEALMGKRPKDQIDVLRQVDGYYKQVYQRAIVAISAYGDVARQRDLAIQERNTAQKELENARKISNVAKEALSEEKKKMEALRQENIKLRKYIKDHVNPTMAEAYLQEHATKQNWGEYALPVVTGSVQTQDKKNYKSIKELFATVDNKKT